MALLMFVPGINPAADAAQRGGKLEADAVSLARQTLAAGLSVPIDRVTPAGVTPAQWRDSSLGCPERGITYTPALASGYEVRLRVDEAEHVVHVAGGRAVICSSASNPKQPPSAAISASLKAAGAVRRAVATRLGIEPARVRIASTRPFKPSPSCPAAPASPKGTALVVEAEAAARTFLYYADDATVVNCEKSEHP